MKKSAPKALSFHTLKSRNTKARNLINKGREEIERVAREEKLGATKRQKVEIDRIVDEALAELDRLELENDSNLIRIERLESQKDEQFAPYLVAETELLVRGYWDAYPKSDQRRNAKNYRHIPTEWRQNGPTAYDQIAETWDRLTPFERAHLEVRVAYGMNPVTGKILPSSYAALERSGFIIRPLLNREDAVEGIVKLLVRGDMIDTPRGYSKSKREKMKKKGGRTREDALSPVPIGLEWWIVPNDNTEYRVL